MFFIPGIVITVLTFPGVIVHEAAHMLFCKLRGVAIFDVCFFRFGNPAGYVVHETSPDFTSTFLISVGPFIVNSALCLLFCLPAAIPVRVFDRMDPLLFFQMWIGISIGMHAFPSTGDAQVLWKQAKKAAAARHPLAILSFPVVGLIYVAQILSFVWFDAIYGFALGVWLPILLLDRAL